MSSQSPLEKISHRYDIVTTNIKIKRKEITKLQAEKNQLEKKMYSLCKHKWVEKRVQNGPYTDYLTVCEKCNLQSR